VTLVGMDEETAKIFGRERGRLRAAGPSHSHAASGAADSCTLDTSLSNHLLWCSSDIVHAWFSYPANRVVPCPTLRLACDARSVARACGKLTSHVDGRDQRVVCYTPGQRSFSYEEECP
jgi:hypothetical protein